jgi:hypothetical protein
VSATAADFRPGDRVTWKAKGFVCWQPDIEAEVMSTTAKRVRIMTKDGRARTVTPGWLTLVERP